MGEEKQSKAKEDFPHWRKYAFCILIIQSVHSWLDSAQIHLQAEPEERKYGENIGKVCTVMKCATILTSVNLHKIKR